MNELTTFKNPMFGEIRTIEEDGKVLFCGSDVAKALGYKNASKTLSDHCKGVTKQYIPRPQNPDQPIEMSFIPEGDVYRLITRSKLPGVEKFESWILGEITPTIHQWKNEHKNIGTDIKCTKNDELTTFNNPVFGKVRTLSIDNEPWFVGKDVAEALGYVKPENALAAHIEDIDKTTTLIQGDGSNYKSKTTIINESGLYSLILSSKLPTAKEFKHWVTSEVLPSIRKYGGYITGQENMSGDELMARAILFAQNKICELESKAQALNAKIEEDAPAVAFANDIANSKGAITFDQYTKSLFDHYEIKNGRNRLFSLLREMGVLKSNNIPYQKYMEYGWFRVREVVKKDTVYNQTLIRGVGQQKIYEIIKENYQT